MFPTSSLGVVPQRNDIAYDSEPERVLARQRRIRRKYEKMFPSRPDSPGPSNGKTQKLDQHDNDKAHSIIELTDSDTSVSRLSSAAPIASGSTKPQHNPYPHHEIDEDHDEVAPVRKLDIGHFAFANPACGKGRSATAKPPARGASAAATEPRRARGKQPTNDIVISPSDLDKISRCIGCDAEWTTRKTGVQKLNHIRTCAKKHYLDKETVDILVQQVVAKYTPPANTKGKAKEIPPPPPEPLTKATVYEEVLGGAAPKKRTKRQPAQTLLTNVSANREDILAQARNVLQAAPSMSSVAQSPRETSPHRSSSPSYQQPSITQPFGTSLLRAKRGTNTKSLFNAILSSSPPGATHQIVSERPNNDDDGEPIVDDDEPLCSKVSRPRTHRQVAFEEEWESHMKEAIMKDDKLYIRVLRFEPIHFNEFLPVAESFQQPDKLPASTARLKAALRKYLDDQAIHFYDESWKPRKGNN